MTKYSYVMKNPPENVVTISRLRTFGALTMVGGAVLTVGAVLTDFGSYADLPAVGSLGSALSAVAGLGLVFLPVGLLASRVGGTGALSKASMTLLEIGICLASVSDIPAGDL